MRFAKAPRDTYNIYTAPAKWKGEKKIEHSTYVSAYFYGFSFFMEFNLGPEHKYAREWPPRACGAKCMDIPEDKRERERVSEMKCKKYTYAYDIIFIWNVRFYLFFFFLDFLSIWIRHTYNNNNTRVYIHAGDFKGDRCFSNRHAWCDECYFALACTYYNIRWINWHLTCLLNV